MFGIVVDHHHLPRVDDLPLTNLPEIVEVGIEDAGKKS
jgi:hypothetical protein